MANNDVHYHRGPTAWSLFENQVYDKVLIQVENRVARHRVEIRDQILQDTNGSN